MSTKPRGLTTFQPITAGKQANPQANAHAWEAEIDRLVYALYGLTPAEIALVKDRADGR